MEKVDFKKKFKDLYAASAKKHAIVKVPAMNFLMVDGQSAPASESFQNAIQCLYGMAFTAKFILKEDETTPDYVVPPLEGLWDAGDMVEFDLTKKDAWKWTLMIMQPEWFTRKVYEKTRDILKEKKDPAALPRLRFENFDEGLTAQIMHIGPYDTEPAVIEKLHEFIEQQGHKPRGKHHEIYLSDPRRCQPEKLKTILRQPIK